MKSLPNNKVRNKFRKITLRLIYFNHYFHFFFNSLRNYNLHPSVYIFTTLYIFLKKGQQKKLNYLHGNYYILIND